jgi:hypothetical protein
MAILYTCWAIGIFTPVWVSTIEKNLATLHLLLKCGICYSKGCRQMNCFIPDSLGTFKTAKVEAEK